MTPAGTSNELDVQNGWEENTKHTSIILYYCRLGGAGKEMDYYKVPGTVNATTVDYIHRLQHFNIRVPVLLTCRSPEEKENVLPSL